MDSTLFKLPWIMKFSILSCRICLLLVNYYKNRILIFKRCINIYGRHFTKKGKEATCKCLGRDSWFLGLWLCSIQMISEEVQNRERWKIHQQNVATWFLTAFDETNFGGVHLVVDWFLAALRQKYFWPKLHKTVKDHILSWNRYQCITIDSKRKNPSLNPLPIVGAFERWHMDSLN